MRRAGLEHGRGADAGLHERGGARSARRPAASCTSAAARAGSSGTRARPRATPRRCGRCATTATPTRCWRSSSPPAPPATPASARASTAATWSPPRPTRCCPGSSARSPQRAAERPEGSYTAALLADPPSIGEKVAGGGRGGRPRRSRGDRRARRRGGRRRALPPDRPAALARARPRGRHPGARLTVAAESLDVTPTVGRDQRAGRRAQPDPGHAHLHRGLRDAGLGVPEAARRRARRSCSSPPSRASASGAGRSSATSRAAWCAGAWPTGATPTRSPRRRSRATGRRRIAGLPPFAGGAVGFFGYDCVRAVERLGGAQPRPARAAGHGADALRRAGGVRPPEPHGDDPGQRLRRRGRRRRGRPRRAPSRRSARCASAWPARCRAPSGPRPPRPEPQFESNMPREAFEGMVARIVEYVHAGDAFQVVPSQRCRAPRAGRPVLDLPRPARGQPLALHVLPRLRGLPDRRRLARAARHRVRAATSPPGRSPARARAAPTPRRTSGSPRSCWPTRRSGPST